jgi:hypothetical protein
MGRLIMGFLLLILFVLGLILLIVSFFKEDSIKQLEDQIEGTSVTVMQELYKIKKKIRVLEEELMIEDRDV